MCELLGINSNFEVNPKFSFKELKLRGGGTRRHRYGWGIGFYKDGKCQIVKEAKPAYNSPLAKEVEDGIIPIQSKIIISHIRIPTSGEPDYKNTHPFTKTLFGKDWIFAHNGSVGEKECKSGVFKLHTGSFVRKGDTDSEQAFCYILDQLSINCKENDSIEKIASQVLSSAKEIKKRGKGHFNFLLSDGVFLFAYGDNSLYYLERKWSENEIILSDADYNKIKVSDMKRIGEKAVVIATSPITKTPDKSLYNYETWTKIDEDHLLVFKDGLLKWKNPSC